MSILNKGLGAVATMALLMSFHAPADAAGDPATAVIAVINGKSLTQADFNTFVLSRVPPDQVRNLNQQQLNNLSTDYIDVELIYQDALKKGADKSPEVVTALENQRRSLIAGYMIRQIASSPIADDELEKAYKRLMSKPTKEYKTRHILVGSEETAQQVIAALDKGTPFEQVAKEKSIDTPTAAKGGEIGWVAAEQLTPALRDAVVDTKKGTYSKKPVKTDFGWHVLRVDDMRIVPPPAFNDVKEDLRRRLHNDAIRAYVAQLRKEGQVELKSAATQ